MYFENAKRDWNMLPQGMTQRQSIKNRNFFFSNSYFVINRDIPHFHIY